MKRDILSEEICRNLCAARQGEVVLGRVHFLAICKSLFKEFHTGFGEFLDYNYILVDGTQVIATYIKPEFSQFLSAA